MGWTPAVMGHRLGVTSSADRRSGSRGRSMDNAMDFASGHTKSVFMTVRWLHRCNGLPDLLRVSSDRVVRSMGGLRRSIGE